jgi:hypothetical protein
MEKLPQVESQQEGLILSEILTKLEAYTTREGGLIEAMVPVDLIDRDEVPVDDVHVQELAESMLEETKKGITSGQLTPILLGQVPGKNTFSIIDGFHRDAALKETGKKFIFATIRPNTTEDEVDDLRILTATSHSSVSFARINDWVSSAWAKSPWAEIITPAQAFSLASNKRMNGRYIGLSEQQAEAVRQWAFEKCDKWHMAAITIQKVMATAQIADPDLVSQARTRRSGHVLETLTPDHLGAIARAFPNRFEEQRRIADVALAQNLTIAATKRVLEFLEQTTATSEVLDTIEVTDWATFLSIEPEFTQTQQPKKKRASRRPSGNPDEEEKRQSAELKSQIVRYTAARIAIGRLMTDNDVLRGQYLAAPLHDKRTPAFIIDYPPYGIISESLKQPATNEQTVEDFLTRFESLEPKLMATLTNNVKMNEAEAHHTLRTIGQRISRDIEVGALRYVEFSRQQMFDELIQNCLRDEVQAFREQPSAIVTSLSPEPKEFSLEIALLAMPTLKEQAQTALALSGFMKFGTHSISQVTNTNILHTNQLLETIRQRLDGTERIYGQSVAETTVANG